MRAALQRAARGFGYLLKDRVLNRRLPRVGAARRPRRDDRPGGHLQLLGRAGCGPLDELTPREREVLELMAQGLSNRGICEKLVVSPKTVETHVNAIFWKLGLLPAQDEHRRVLAVLAFFARRYSRLGSPRSARALLDRSGDSRSTSRGDLARHSWYW
jgi:DNA-binding NarL/FixJ family response regulator